ncbi:hypothetical protein [Ulvibacter antarcticus]|nr:hypothetical protein [Ulvibacter antarcticus]
MKTNFIIILLFFFGIISCSKPYEVAKKENLGGYWEIQSVEMPDGTMKHFSFNAIVEFIEVTGDSGVRTKVSPQLDGTFITNETSEKFIVKIENDSLRLLYETPYDSWKETVIKATDSSLQVKNKENKLYSYRKFEKFNFE